MNAEECKVIQGLVSDLDNTRFIYATLEPLLSRPHLRFLVSRIIDSHVAIADDMAQQVMTSGGVTLHRIRGIWVKVAAWFEAWFAAAHVDVDLRCLERIARRETCLVTTYYMALEDVKGMPKRFRNELSGLQRMLFRIEWLVHAAESGTAGPRRGQARKVVRIARHEREGAEVIRPLRGDAVSTGSSAKKNGLKAVDEDSYCARGSNRHAGELYYGLALDGATVKMRRSGQNESQDDARN